MLCGLSGGVDSAVAGRADPRSHRRPARSRCFIDTACRLDEAKTVVDLFRHHYNIPLVHGCLDSLFLGELEGVTDPETKRKTISRLFVEVFEAEAKKIGGADFLAQARSILT